MKLKNATLIASIGTFLMLLSEIYYTFIGANGIGKVFGFFYLFGIASLFIFFITLYSNQKGK